MIRKEAWPFYRTSSGVCLCWELEEPKGPKGLCTVCTSGDRGANAPVSGKGNNQPGASGRWSLGHFCAAHVPRNEPAVISSDSHRSMVVRGLSYASTARLLCRSECQAYCAGGGVSRFVPRDILKDSFTYCLIRAGRSPRSAQLTPWGGTESLPDTLWLVVQLVQVYTTGADLIFVGVD